MRLKYTIVIVGSPDDAPMYSAHAPDVPGCSVNGKTSDDDARSEMQKVLQSHIERLHENGEPIPEPKTSEDDAYEPYRSGLYDHDDKIVGTDKVDVEIPPGARFS